MIALIVLCLVTTAVLTLSGPVLILASVAAQIFTCLWVELASRDAWLAFRAQLADREDRRR